jgi:hypothetical protein
MCGSPSGETLRGGRGRVIQGGCAERFEIGQGPVQCGAVAGEAVPFVERYVKRKQRDFILSLMELR